jgi:hypothetical protein
VLSPVAVPPGVARLGAELAPDAGRVAVPGPWGAISTGSDLPSD